MKKVKIAKVIRRGWNRILNWLIPSFESLLPPPSRLDKRKDLKRYDIGEYSWGHLVVSNRSPDSYLKIGKFCSFAYGCHILLGGEHRSDFITTYRLYAYDPFRKLIKKADHNESSTKGNVSIGNDVWVGHNSIILSGVEIGNGAIIGAGSVVRRNVPAYSIVAGNPARVAGFRFEQQQIDELERIEWWNWPLERIVGNVDILMSENVEDFIKKNQR